MLFPKVIKRFEILENSHVMNSSFFVQLISFEIIKDIRICKCYHLLIACCLVFFRYAISSLTRTKYYRLKLCMVIPDFSKLDSKFIANKAILQK